MPLQSVAPHRGSNTFFITGTGTGVGKTFVLKQAVQYLARQGQAVLALKPVMSGVMPGSMKPGPDANDAVQLLEAMGSPPTPEAVDAISPWRFTAPLSPAYAAIEANTPLDFDAIIGFCLESIANAPYDTLYIEGVGGVMSPITPERTCLDLVAALRIPAVLVSGSYLGSISHTLTAVEALRMRNVPLQALIVSETPDAPMSLIAHVEALSKFLPAARILAVPNMEADAAGNVTLPHSILFRLSTLLRQPTRESS